MNDCTLQIPLLPAALRTISAETHPPGQATSKYAGSDGFNSTAILHCEDSQYLVLLVGWAVLTTTLEPFIRLCPLHFAQIVI